MFFPKLRMDSTLALRHSDVTYSVAVARLKTDSIKLFTSLQVNFFNYEVRVQSSYKANLKFRQKLNEKWYCLV